MTRWEKVYAAAWRSTPARLVRHLLWRAVTSSAWGWAYIRTPGVARVADALPDSLWPRRCLCRRCFPDAYEET